MRGACQDHQYERTNGYISVFYLPNKQFGEDAGFNVWIANLLPIFAVHYKCFAYTNATYV